MPVVSAIVGAVVTAIGLTGTFAAVATFAIKTALVVGVSSLIGNRLATKGAGQQDSGSRVQLPPATNNKLPVMYGEGILGPAIFDAKISSDQKTMWYCCIFAEVPDNSTTSFTKMYYDNREVRFQSPSSARVTGLITNSSGTSQIDTKIDGDLFIYLFPNGVNSGVNTGGQSAIQIMSDAGIRVNERWNGPIYTSNGESVQLNNACFAIVRVNYNQDDQVTSLGSLSALLSNTLTLPGDVIRDYMTNDRYGCGIPISQIDIASLTALNVYSDLPIIYTDVNGQPAQQPRYRINGPVDTGQNCMRNLDYLLDACDTWLNYNEISGQWKAIINQSYTEAGQTITDLFYVSDENLTSGIDISPLDLNSTFNQLEFQYPNRFIKDQVDFVNISLFEEYPALLSTNEPINKLVIQTDIINNYVQAKFIGIRRLLQSREDLVINFGMDYSGIQIDAGDVIRLAHDKYGWAGKLFRVSQVLEEKGADGSLGTRITAFEYNDTVYDNDLDITDFIPEDNTGLTDPNIIDKPEPPTVYADYMGSINQLFFEAQVPNIGLVTNMDFNYGNTANSQEHKFLYSAYNADGSPLDNGEIVNRQGSDLPAGEYYFSVTARNKSAGIRSDSTGNTVLWQGPEVSVVQGEFVCNASAGNTVITHDPLSMPVLPGATVLEVESDGTLTPRANSVIPGGTLVVNSISTTQTEISANIGTQTDFCVGFEQGGIRDQIRDDSITSDQLSPGGNAGDNLYSDGQGDVYWAPPAGGGNPGGNFFTTQYNNNGVFGGIPFTNYNGGQWTLGAETNLRITGGNPGDYLASDGTGGLQWIPASGSLPVEGFISAVAAQWGSAQWPPSGNLASPDLGGISDRWPMYAQTRLSDSNKYNNFEYYIQCDSAISLDGNTRDPNPTSSYFGTSTYRLNQQLEYNSLTSEGFLANSTILRPTGRGTPFPNSWWRKINPNAGGTWSGLGDGVGGWWRILDSSVGNLLPSTANTVILEGSIAYFSTVGNPDDDFYPTTNHAIVGICPYYVSNDGRVWQDTKQTSYGGYPDFPYDIARTTEGYTSATSGIQNKTFRFVVNKEFLAIDNDTIAGVGVCMRAQNANLSARGTANHLYVFNTWGSLKVTYTNGWNYNGYT